MENVKLINKYLESTYGRALDNKPKFRVAWSEDLFEVRKGLFFPLQVVETIERAHKYSMISDKYILEVYTRAFPDVFAQALKHSNEVIMESDGYEPIRVFMDRDGNYLPPHMGVCKIFCDSFIELINRPEAKRLTAKQANYEDVQKMRQEVDKFYELLSANDSDLLAGRFVHKEAIMLPGKDWN